MPNTGKPKTSQATVGGPFAPTRWAALARAVGIESESSIAIALSGGADSVYLARVLAVAEPRPRLLALHVDHALRGEESARDALFAARLCDELDIPFRRIESSIEPGPGVEARAREARYDALCRAARAADIGIIATGHHADDALETLLQRMVRGTSIAGLAGLEKRVVITRAMTSDPRARVASEFEVLLVRPLLALRREEVRRTLREAGYTWVEDGSNASLTFTRNRIRHGLLPRMAEIAGENALSNLQAFGAAIEELEENCAALTADIFWADPPHAALFRDRSDHACGGVLQRAKLARLQRPLLARALWRLLSEGVGAAPTRATLERIVDDVARGRTTFHQLPRDFSLQLRSDEIWLMPPQARRRPGSSARTAPAPELPFDPPPTPVTTARAHRRLESAPSEERVLAVPGRVVLDDGRTIEASVFEVGARAPISRSALVAELDLARLVSPLRVRFPCPGDRFAGLGAPGSKALSRFLADAGVPRANRSRVPLVVAGEEIVWVAGIRPAARAAVSGHTTRRLVLTLVPARAAPPGPRAAPGTAKLPFG